MFPLLLVARLALSPVPDLVSAYLDLTFETFPVRATEAGVHERDGELGDLSREGRARFLAANRDALVLVKAALQRDLGPDDRRDADVLLRQISLTIHEHGVLHFPERLPLWWTRIASDATLSLLLREDLPLAARVESAASRAERIPRLLSDATAALSRTSDTYLAPDLCRAGAAHARSLAAYYRGAFADAARGEAADQRPRLLAAGARAALALDDFAALCDTLAGRAVGVSRLGPDYQDRYRLVTGSAEPVASVLARAERALVERRTEAADYGRRVWSRVMDGDAPADDGELLARLFARVEADHAASREELVARIQALVPRLESFLRRADLVTLPDPLTLVTEASPATLLGQSVGGVYGAGPFAPDAQTLFLLPVPREGSTAEQAEVFFRGFNDHFMSMILAHELLPGHYLQMKTAARRAPAVRSVFPNGAFVEGWGTFSERLALDAGWGGPLERLAHLKKRLENAARAILDIRYHTRGLRKDDAARLFREEALQDEQLFENAWNRTTTTPPQLTTYFVGEEELSALYARLCTEGGAALGTRTLVDAILSLGPLTVREIGEAFEGEPPGPR